jgi:hypothetical protein
MALSTTEGFQSTRNAPFAIPSGPDEDGSRMAKSEDWAAIFKAKKRLRKPKYDLGIGKNKAVNFNMAASSEQKDNNDIDNARVGAFIVEYEGVRKFPSPLREEIIESLPSGTKKKALPKVQPRRMVSELFDITALSTDAHPVMIPLYGSSAVVEQGMVEPLKLDPNTIWVEMMLHDEMSKLLSAYS